MKKFIRYLYEYRNGRRVQNVGFVKVEESDDSAVIQIYGKGFPAAGNQALEILLFYLEGNQVIGVPMGVLQNTNPMSGYQLAYDTTDVGGWDVFRRVEGVMLRHNHSAMPRLYASTWQEKPINVMGMIERSPQAVEEPEMSSEFEPESREELVMEAESRMEEPSLSPRMSSESSSELSPEMSSEMSSEFGSGSQMESRESGYSGTPSMESSSGYSGTPVMESGSQMESRGGYSGTAQMRSSEGGYSGTSSMRSREGGYSETPSMEGSSGYSGTPSMESREGEYSETPEMEQVVYKIGRQDLVALPRNEWKLANNHFLMHGCRNFHHLLSFEKDGECWLGVPGIYHPKEQSAAHAFGFGQFMKPEEGDVMLSEDEHTSNGEFGYWCRTVSKVIDKSKL